MSESVTLDADVDAGLSHLASTTGRSKSALVNEALRAFVTSEQQFLSAVEEGKQAMREGRTIEHSAVAASLARLLDTEG